MRANLPVHWNIWAQTYPSHQRYAPIKFGSRTICCAHTSPSARQDPSLAVARPPNTEISSAIRNPGTKAIITIACCLCIHPAAKPEAGPYMTTACFWNPHCCANPHLSHPTRWSQSSLRSRVSRFKQKNKMQITFVLLFLPHLFDVLLASPLIPRDLPQRDSFHLRPRLYDESGRYAERQARSDRLDGLVARDNHEPTWTFESCSNDQLIKVKGAVEKAVGYVKDSLTFLKEPPAGSLRYKWWFGEGTTTSKSWQNAIKTFETINSHLSHTAYVCVAGPHPRSPNGPVSFELLGRDKPGRMSLYTPFLEALPQDQARILIYAFSYYCGGAEKHTDLDQTKQRCLNLARHNPTFATRNAASYVMFALNEDGRTPAMDHSPSIYF